MCTNMEVSVKSVLSYIVVIYVFKCRIQGGEGCVEDSIKMLHCPKQNTTKSMEVSLERCRNGSWTPVCAESLTGKLDNLTHICKQALGPRSAVKPELRLSRTGHTCNMSTPPNGSVNITLTSHNDSSENCTRTSYIVCKVVSGFSDEKGDVFTSYQMVSWNQSRIWWHNQNWQDECDDSLCGQEFRSASISYGWARNTHGAINASGPAWTTSAFVYQGKKLRIGERTPDSNATDLRQCAKMCLDQPDTIQAVAFSIPDCYCINKIERDFTESSPSMSKSTPDIELYHVIEKTQVPAACRPFDERPRLCIAWIGKVQFDARECGQNLPVLCTKEECRLSNHCGGWHVCATYMADHNRCACNCNQKQDRCIVDSNPKHKNYSRCYCLDAAGNLTKLDACPRKENNITKIVTPPTSPTERESQSNDTLMQVLTLSLTISVVIGLVIATVCYIVRRSRRRRRESRLPNATNNRTYGDNSLLLNEQETYAMVGDLDPELDMAVTPSAPLLPQRKRVLKNGIATLDDYSCPNDVVDHRYSDSTGYAMTYDDTRRKRTKSDGDLNVSQLQSSQEQQCIKGSRKPFSSEKDRSKNNSNETNVWLNLPEEKRVQKGCSAHQNPNSVVFRNTNNTHEDQVCHEHENAKEIAHQNSVNSATTIENTIASGRPTSILSQEKSRTSGSRNKDDGRRGSDHSDYEDTTISAVEVKGRLTSQLSTDSYEETSLATAAGHNCTAKSSLFQEHVCLDCIPPEVLRNLGIRIVAEDDVYETYYNFRRSLDRVYDEEKVYCMQDRSQKSKNYFILAKPTANSRELCEKVNDGKCLNDMVYDAIDRNRRRPSGNTNVYDHISHLKRPLDIARVTQRRFSL